VIDCDKVYHDLLATDKAMLSAIEARFPGTVEHGVLQRKKLGSIVFSDEQALLELNAITHKAVKLKVLELLPKVPSLVAIDAIGLFEGGLAELCDTTVAITAPEDQRIARLMEREGTTQEYAASRIAAQKSNDHFSSLCRHTLENNGNMDAFATKCLAFFMEVSLTLLGKKSPNMVSTPIASPWAETSANLRSKTFSTSGSCSPQKIVAPGFIIPAFTCAISSREFPKNCIWSKLILVNTQANGLSTTLVASPISAQTA
jgi:dephospho-CoA kinase